MTVKLYINQGFQKLASSATFRELVDTSAFYLAEIGGHVIGTRLILIGMKLIERLIELLWHEPKLFAESPFAFPFKWLFDLADAILLLGFLALVGTCFLYNVLQQISLSRANPAGPRLPPKTVVTIVVRR